MSTFTPLLGLSDVVMYFLPEGRLIDYDPNEKTTKFVIQADWGDCGHLTDEQKDQLWSSIPAYQRDARTKGVPALGSGAIYPVPESEITIRPFELPPHWPRVYALDVGWNQTAALWAAWDRDEDILYFYSEYYKGQAEPAIHAAAVRARGDWIPGVIDPASRGRTQTDGARLIDLYRDHGLLLAEAKNEVEAGIYNVWERLSTGRIKVFNNLNNWLMEFRIYRRDEKGKIVKYKDHLLDATRYLVMSGLDHASTKPSLFDEGDQYWANMSRNAYTGY